jgi:hypothetical protein
MCNVNVMNVNFNYNEYENDYENMIAREDRH